MGIGISFPPFGRIVAASLTAVGLGGFALGVVVGAWVVS
jgi:hypothetical protein